MRRTCTTLLQAGASLHALLHALLLSHSANVTWMLPSFNIHGLPCRMPHVRQRRIAFCGAAGAPIWDYVHMQAPARITRTLRCTADGKSAGRDSESCQTPHMPQSAVAQGKGLPSGGAWRMETAPAAGTGDTRTTVRAHHANGCGTASFLSACMPAVIGSSAAV